MGLHVEGMAAWLRDLETLPERAPKAFRQVVKRGGIQITRDWRARWRVISHPKGHIPHLIRAVDFDDVIEEGPRFSVSVGVDPKSRQAFLSKIISFGTLTSAPHDAGKAALEAEAPNMQYWAGKVAAELLEEGGASKVPIPADD